MLKEELIQSIGLQVSYWKAGLTPTDETFNTITDDVLHQLEIEHQHRMGRKTGDVIGEITPPQIKEKAMEANLKGNCETLRKIMQTREKIRDGVERDNNRSQEVTHPHRIESLRQTLKSAKEELDYIIAKIK